MGRTFPTWRGVPRLHKTESLSRRYAIADERDLRVAVEKLDAMRVVIR